MVFPLRRHDFSPCRSNPLKENATTGLSSSVLRELSLCTAGQAGSGTPIVVNTVFQEATNTATMPQRPIRDHGSTNTTRARVCGACSACCKHLLIPAGDVGPGMKPAGIPCPNVTAAGCRIYGRRPETCVDFACAWLDDTDWPESWRPDHSGLFCLRADIEPGTPAAAVYELWPDSLQTSVAAEILTELKRTTMVVAIINARQERQKLLGNWVASPPEPAVPAPHFVGRSRTKSRTDSARVPLTGE